MPFIERFELLNLVHYDVVETWATRESGLGRPLLLHRYPKTSGLREQLQSMPLEELSMILKAGEDGDYFFVVTQDTPDFRRFLDWVGRFSSPAEAAVAEVNEPSQPAELAEPTLTFRTANAPPPPPALAEQSQKPAAEPGEFTRMFKGPAVPPQRPAPATPLTPPAVSREPGEFTKLFKAPVPEALPAAPKAKPSPPNPGPGEFTQLFAQPNQSAPPPKTAAEPGELTRLFKGPAVPPQRPAPPAGSQQPGEFTKLFNNPLPETPLAARLDDPLAAEKPAASLHEPGDFTKMFGRPGQNSPDRNAPANLSSAADRPADLAAATGIFSKRSVFETASPQAPLTAGPGEYTRMFQPSSAAEGAAASAPAQAEQKPPAPPPAAKKQPQSTPVALIVILAVIAVVAIALILYFVMKR